RARHPCRAGRPRGRHLRRTAPFLDRSPRDPLTQPIRWLGRSPDRGSGAPRVDPRGPGVRYGPMPHEDPGPCVRGTGRGPARGTGRGLKSALCPIRSTRRCLRSRVAPSRASPAGSDAPSSPPPSPRRARTTTACAPIAPLLELMAAATSPVPGPSPALRATSAPSTALAPTSVSVRAQRRSAKYTGLPSDAADLVTAAQAWHWFDLEPATAEALW